MSKKLPWQKWFWADWKADQRLRLCSLEARGLWVEMLGIMVEGEPFGHLNLNDKVIDEVTLSRLIGATQGEVERGTKELEGAKVFSRSEDGVIYSRRLVREEATRRARAEGGKLGGNPALGVRYNRPGFLYLVKRRSNGWVKIGISVSPNKRIYKLRKQLPNDQVDLIAQGAVDDMGAAERSAHLHFESLRAEGEWFDPDSQSLLRMQNMIQQSVFPLKATLKDSPNPRVQSPESRGQRPDSELSGASAGKEGESDGNQPQEDQGKPRVADNPQDEHQAQGHGHAEGDRRQAPVEGEAGQSHAPAQAAAPGGAGAADPRVGELTALQSAQKRIQDWFDDSPDLYRPGGQNGWRGSTVTKWLRDCGGKAGDSASWEPAARILISYLDECSGKEKLKPGPGPVKNAWGFLSWMLDEYGPHGLPVKSNGNPRRGDSFGMPAAPNSSGEDRGIRC